MILDKKIESSKTPAVWEERTGDHKELAEIAKIHNGLHGGPATDLASLYGLREGQKGLILRRSGKPIGFLTYEISESKKNEKTLCINYLEIDDAERSPLMFNGVFELLQEICLRENVEYISWNPATSEGRRLTEKVSALSSANREIKIPMTLFNREALLEAMRRSSL